MTPAASITRLSMTYPPPRVGGRLITRLPERPLEWAVLDAATADEMGREHVGWFVGAHPGPARAAEQFGRLDDNPGGGVWVVVPHSRDLSCELFAGWPHTKHVTKRPRSGDSAWRSRKVWVAVPEDLERLLSHARTIKQGLAGVVILDPECIIYKARGGTDSWGRGHLNDRPQHVVNFRADLNVDGWHPPLLLLTKKPAKAVNTDVVARAFCLNAFRYLSGASFDCWDAVEVEQG